MKIWDHDVALEIHGFLDCPDALRLRQMCRAARTHTRARILDVNTCIPLHFCGDTLACLHTLILDGTAWSRARWASLRAALPEGLRVLSVSHTNLDADAQSLASFPRGLERLAADRLRGTRTVPPLETTNTIRALLGAYPGLVSLSLRDNGLVFMPEIMEALVGGSRIRDLDVWGNQVFFHAVKTEVVQEALACQQTIPPNICVTERLACERGATLRDSLRTLRISSAPEKWPSSNRLYDVRIDALSFEQQVQMWFMLPESVRFLSLTCHGPFITRPVHFMSAIRRTLFSVRIWGVPCLSALQRVSGLRQLTLRQGLHLGDLDLRGWAETLEELDLSYTWPNNIEGINACEGLTKINTRGWARARVRALRETLPCPRRITHWTSSHDVPGIARACPNLRHLVSPYILTGARLGTSLLEWDMTSCGLSAVDVNSFLHMMGDGVCPLLRAWSMDHNPGIGPAPWRHMAAHMNRRPLNMRERIREIRVMYTGMNMEAFGDLLRGVQVPGMRLFLLTALDAVVDMYGVDVVLTDLLRQTQATLPTEIRVPPIVHHRLDTYYISMLEERDCIVLPE